MSDSVKHDMLHSVVNVLLAPGKRHLLCFYISISWTTEQGRISAVPQISALVLVILARSWTVIIFLVLLAFTVVEDAMAVLLK